MNAPAAMFHLTVEGAHAVTWAVQRVQGVERIHSPFRFHVVAQVVAGDGTSTLDLDELVAQPAHLSWPVGESTRTIHGVVDQISCDADYYEIVIVPRVALLGDRIDQKVFLQKTAVEIATAVFAEHGLAVESRLVTTPPPLPQCVQAFESDLTFVSRILADEGVAWFVGKAEDVIVLTDHDDGYDAIAESLPLVEPGTIVRGRSVHYARVDIGVVPDKVTLRDYNWKTPVVDLESTVGDGNLEVYEFPGRFSTTGEGQRVAAMRLEERRARARCLVAESTAREISAGSIVTIQSSEPEVDGEWLVVEAVHEDFADLAEHGLGRDVVVRFVATPKTTPWRPERLPRPAMHGIQHAVTTGPAGQEIHTDPYARVKVLLRWDRLGKKDDTSSTWVRTLQPPTSGGFMLPRTGWEVVLGFTGGSADAPVVLGRLANGAARPPESLPGKKTMSSFGSLTSPGGGAKNLVRMDDAAGAEAFDLIASYDLNEKTENDKVTVVKGSETDSVGVDRTLIVGQVHALTVVGSQTHTVGANRDVSVDANMQISAAAESISIGAMRVFKVGGDSTIGCATLSRVIGSNKVETAIEHQMRAVTGAASVLVGGGWNAVAGTQATVGVGGISSQTVGGPKTIKTTKDYSMSVKGLLEQTFASRAAKGGSKIAETYEASAKYSIDGSAKIKGSDIVIIATDKITISADGLKVVITSDSIKIDGKFEGSVGAIDDGDESYA